MRPGAGLYVICRYRGVPPHSLPAESRSFVGMAMETAAMPPATKDFLHLCRWFTRTHTHTWKHPEGRRWNEIKWTMSYNLMKFTGAIPNFKPTTNHKLNMTWQWTKSKYKAVLLLAACHTHALNANWKKKQSSPWSIGGHKLNGLSVLNPCHCATDASSLDGDMWSTLHPTPSPSSQNSVLCTCMEPFIAGL